MSSNAGGTRNGLGICRPRAVLEVGQSLMDFIRPTTELNSLSDFV